MKLTGLRFPAAFRLSFTAQAQSEISWDHPHPSRAECSCKGFEHCSHKQREEGGVGEVEAGKRLSGEGLLQSQLQGTKTWRGKQAVGPPPNLLAGEGAICALGRRCTVTAMRLASLQSWMLRWQMDPAPQSLCYLFNKFN